MNGFLNLLKPPGMTSSDAVVFVRKTLNGEKVGHAGTLDPEASGVLPIMIGKAARLFDVLAEKQKEYIAEIAFGVATDTQDAQGHAVQRSEALPHIDAVCDVLPRFIGNIMQIPPAFSALKVGGKAAYQLARAGEEAVLAARPARVDKLSLLEQTGRDSALLHVVCGKGVYIRTLCHDIGIALDCPAHMRFLLRTRTGTFAIEDSVTLEAWRDATDREALLMPMDMPLAHLPSATVNVRYAHAVRNGNALSIFERADDAVFSGEMARVYCGQAFAGLGRWRDGAFRFQSMLME